MVQDVHAAGIAASACASISPASGLAQMPTALPRLSKSWIRIFSATTRYLKPEFDRIRDFRKPQSGTHLLADPAKSRPLAALSLPATGEAIDDGRPRCEA